MLQSLSKLLIHVVFSTKDREGLVKTEGIKERLYAYWGGICRQKQSPLLAAGGMADHVHLVVDLRRTQDVADLVKEIKRTSSLWLPEQFGELLPHGFEWQRGYGAFTIGQSQLDHVKRYIDQQPEHHRKADFKDEFRQLCQKYNVEYDERYCWD